MLGMSAPIYLDHNATTPMLPEVADAVREASRRYYGNPASQHEPGRAVRRALEAARERIAELLGASTAGMDADAVIFTSGGTEANNLAVAGLGLAGDERAAPRGRRLIISALEHPSVARTAEHLAGPPVPFLPGAAGGDGWSPSAAAGGQLRVLGVDSRGVTDLACLAELLDASRPLPSPLVSIMLASNETGVLQPVAEAAELCRGRGALIHTDATQAVGKIPVDFRALGVDAMTVTAHKFHGPPGVGALVVRHGVPLTPSLHGGFQQSAFRPGTESVALAIGMQTALELWRAQADARHAQLATLRDSFERAVLAGFSTAVVIGGAAPRLPHTSNIALVGLDRQAVVMALDLAGVACSTGSACASGSSEPSPALVAMGLPEDVVSSSVRFSFGATSDDADAAEGARRILSVCNRLRREK